jgi:hypothetical protein
MSGKYAAEHASALADVTDAGAAITFSKGVVTGYNSATDTMPSPAQTPTTVAGFAIESEAKRSYDAGTRVQRDTRRLFFVPSTFGALPLPGATCTWASTAFVTGDVEPIALEGEVIAAYVEISR